ncbi:MAG: creatininase family protein [Gemmatimonadetes bacterium]|nr:creatininase family protein [Gemmatimonadota bacterium]
MPVRRGMLVAMLLLVARLLPAQVRHVGDLNTRELRALDRARTVVILQGGMLEEHGPYLPAFTDGILSARLTSELAAGIARQRPAGRR